MLDILAVHTTKYRKEIEPINNNTPAESKQRTINEKINDRRSDLKVKDFTDNIESDYEREI